MGVDIMKERAMEFLWELNNRMEPGVGAIKEELLEFLKDLFKTTSSRGGRFFWLRISSSSLFPCMRPSGSGSMGLSVRNICQI